MLHDFLVADKIKNQFSKINRWQFIYPYLFFNWNASCYGEEPDIPEDYKTNDVNVNLWLIIYP